jgi:uridylate kinase
MSLKRVYKRILLKLSGEALAGTQGYGIDAVTADAVAVEVRAVRDAGALVGIVLGGGNIFRGLAGAAQGVDRTTGDTVGMLATVINSLLFKESLRRAGVDAVVYSSIQMDKAAEFFIARRAIEQMEKGRVVIIAGGTGNPYFTTDTAAALRCAELRCDALVKGTKVDGIYDSDPAKNPRAVKIDTLTHQEALARGLRIMDASAFSLCMDNNIPIIVCKLTVAGNLAKCVQGLPVGSIVTSPAAPAASPGGGAVARAGSHRSKKGA